MSAILDILKATAKYILSYNGNLSAEEIAEREGKILRGELNDT